MRSSALRAIVDRAAVDPRSAHTDLVALLRESGGPLVEPAGDGRALVTFVVVDAPEQPYLRCALAPGLLGMAPLHRVPSLADAWWVEFETRDDISVPYQFQRRAAKPFPIGDWPPPDGDAVVSWIADLYEISFADRFNPDRIFPEFFGAVGSDASGDGGEGSRVTAPPPEKWESALTLPGAAPFPWHGAAARTGSTHRHQVASAVLGNTRTVTVWTPPGHDCAAGPYPVVVLFDGSGMLADAFGARRTFDNLVSGGQVDPFVAVLVDNASDASRAQELPCNPDMATFVADELLPELTRPYGLSTDPARTVVGGFSYGGLAADWLGLTRPDRFGNVLSMSASLWWGKLPPGNSDPSLGRDGEPEWLTRRFAAVPAVPVRFWLAVGLLESAALAQAEGLSQVAANRHFRDVLTAKGYDLVGYREQPGAHDCLNWRRALPDGLMALLPAQARGRIASKA